MKPRNGQMEGIRTGPCRAGREGGAGKAWSPGAWGMHIPHKAIHLLKRARAKLQAPVVPSA